MRAVGEGARRGSGARRKSNERLLVGRLGLTDRRNHPPCAAVRPPLIDWSAPP
ncbi:DUF5990 family protein [Streptomyces prunicolor]|uniref:DUF5990 family protein n=1 Tax=Streptomyces prunicolor TaxID=67348 RepID=UPI0037157CA0